jgi:hypothetical protein
MLVTDNVSSSQILFTLMLEAICSSEMSVFRLLVTSNVVPSSPILVTLMTEAIHSSETSIITRATRRTNPEDGILHSHRRENFTSYIALTGWALQRGCNISPVRYELGFYIPEDSILHSNRRENLTS